MAHVDTVRHHLPARHWLATVAVYLVLLVVFPVPMIAAGMLICGALMCLSMYVLWSQSHRMEPERRARLDHDVPRSMIGIVLIGVVLSFVFPDTMAVIALGTSVAACAAWFAMERTIQARTRR